MGNVCEFQLKSSCFRIRTGSINGFSDFLGLLFPSCVEFYEIRIFLIWSFFISVNSQKPLSAGWFSSLLQGKWLGECFPEGGESYLKEAELCQISKNFYKYLTRNWESWRFSNQSAKLRSLILALQLSELFMEVLCWQFPCIRRGSGEETDKIAAGGGKDCLAPVALPPESTGAVLSRGLFQRHEGAQIAPAHWLPPPALSLAGRPTFMFLWPSPLCPCRYDNRKKILCQGKETDIVLNIRTLTWSLDYDSNLGFNNNLWRNVFTYSGADFPTLRWELDLFCGLQDALHV